MEKTKRVILAVVILVVIVVLALRGCPRRTHFRSQQSQDYHHIGTFSSTLTTPAS